MKTDRAALAGTFTRKRGIELCANRKEVQPLQQRISQMLINFYVINLINKGED